MVVSLIDQLVAPGVIPLSHFIDPFNGDVLNDRWTFQASGSGSGAMNDIVNGGYKLTTDTTTNFNSRIGFNNINHYAHDGSVCITQTTVGESTLRILQAGLSEIITDSLNTAAIYQDSTDAGANKVLTTALNSTATNVSSGIARDENETVSKVETKTSSALMWLSDDLVSISTSNLPDLALQPLFKVQTRTTAARTGKITYLEAYNT